LQETQWGAFFARCSSCIAQTDLAEALRTAAQALKRWIERSIL
jgi:hypothetical protein